MRRRTFLAASTALAATSALPAGVLAQSTSPLLAPWTGPFGGVPAFDKVKVADFKPALEAAMAQELAEVDAIANNPAAPTFENTIAALEATGRAGDRVSTYYGIWSDTLSTPEVRAVEKEMEPKLAAHADRILQNARLFQRIDAVYQHREHTGLTPEQKRVTELRWNAFVRAGARLNPEQKARVAQINTELAGLFTTFNQNLLHDEDAYVLYLKAADLEGLPADVRAAAASVAKDRGKPGEYGIANTRSSVDPFLTYSARRDLREKVWKTFYSRGDNGDAHDNNAVIKRILKLRVERARILGFPTHAHWRLANNSMAETPDAAMALMMRVWPSATARVREEVAEMQAIADREGAKIKIAPWDYRYYAEKVRKARYDLDMNEAKPYLQLDKLREGMFWASGELYGFSFHPVTGVPVQHPDVTVWEVKRGPEHIGLWYFDPYARQGKRSGAWMNAYRGQETFQGKVTTIVSNNSNFVKGAPGEAVLISWDDAQTMFHEFGHALHGLNSAVTYPSVAGTRVFRDYVEFPSQVNESWLPTPQVLNRFALHHQTGKPIPADLVAKIEKASTFRQGFDVTEYLASAMIDMKLHLAGDADIDPDAFEREELKKLGMPDELPMRHRTPQFGHIFSSDGYSAGYYSYLWSEVIALDAVEAFKEAPGGLYDKAVARKLHDEVMSKGNSVHPREQYRAFRGRDPDVKAYLRDKGFPTT
ncbi:M3 family metallopeptidase [Phenylobacterium sp. J367]|uniref:M3 family metallopeptidase n=1 Tax=Phenylobacterium sp. J367 TaxID=2898435 RepID=UPI0021517F77|nr:M3 family metallopeptidase [Phenylobacterium sp. J367]MCR5878206.1 M3 family metallopeptidase [Phenylobacterium sp. J367]